MMTVSLTVQPHQYLSELPPLLQFPQQNTMALAQSIMPARRFACFGLNASRLKPATTLGQRRGLASQSDVMYGQAPCQKRNIMDDGKYNRFNVGGKVFVVTGGGQGLGLSIAEGLAEAGGTVHILDRSPQPTRAFENAKDRAETELDGNLLYHQVDVANDDLLGKTISEIATRKQRLDGLVAGSWISTDL